MKFLYVSKMYILWLLFVFMGAHGVYATDPTADAQNLINLAKQYKTSAPDKSLEYIQKALVLSIKYENTQQQAECYLLIGEINLNNKLYESALNNTQKANNLLHARSSETSKSISAETKKQKKVPSKKYKVEPTNTLIGNVNLQLAKTLDLNNNSEEALKILNTPSNFSTAQQTTESKLLIAEIYKKQKNYKESIEEYNKVLNNNAINDKDIALINTKIAEVYKDQKLPEKSIEYLKKAKTEALGLENTDILQKINSLLSSELSSKNNYREEISVREQNLSISIKQKDTAEYINEAVALAYLYVRSNQFKKAEDLANRVLYFAQNNHQHLKFEAMAYQVKAMIYQLNGNYPLSNTYYKYYANTIDTLLKIISIKESKSLKTSTLFAEKQKQIELLEKDAEINKKTIEALSNAQQAVDERISRQRIIIWSLTLGIIMVIISTYLIYKNAQKRRIANQLLALKSLRSQMNPHFIFNALNSVNSFISINDEKSANKYLADFSKLMRMVMENSQHEFISLSQEIEILTLYLCLEHFRFQNKFNYSFDIDAQIDRDFVSIPPMIIQPHIENAVWHGLRYTESGGFLKVSINKQSDDSILVLIEDNGIGRRKSQELKTQNQKATKSTGIKNTESRIQLIKELYGRDISLNITDAFPTHTNVGTRVEINIPVHINQENYA